MLSGGLSSVALVRGLQMDVDESEDDDDDDDEEDDSEDEDSEDEVWAMLS